MRPHRIHQLWNQLHNWILPALFALALFAHLGAVLKHHFGQNLYEDFPVKQN